MQTTDNSEHIQTVKQYTNHESQNIMFSAYQDIILLMHRVMLLSKIRHWRVKGLNSHFQIRESFVQNITCIFKALQLTHFKV